MRNQERWLWLAKYKLAQGTKELPQRVEQQRLAGSKAEMLCLCYLSHPSMVVASFKAEPVRSPR